MPEERRVAILVAFAHRLEALAQDDVLDVLFALISEVVTMSKATRKKERFRTIKDLDEAALALKEALDAIFDHELLPDALPLGRAREEMILRAGGEGRIGWARAKVAEISRPPEEDHQEELANLREVGLPSTPFLGTKSGVRPPPDRRIGAPWLAPPGATDTQPCAIPRAQRHLTQGPICGNI